MKRISFSSTLLSLHEHPIETFFCDKIVNMRIFPHLRCFYCSFFFFFFFLDGILRFAKTLVFIARKKVHPKLSGKTE